MAQEPDEQVYGLFLLSPLGMLSHLIFNEMIQNCILLLLLLIVFYITNVLIYISFFPHFCWFYSSELYVLLISMYPIWCGLSCVSNKDKVVTLIDKWQRKNLKFLGCLCHYAVTLGIYLLFVQGFYFQVCDELLYCRTEVLLKCSLMFL